MKPPGRVKYRLAEVLKRDIGADVLKSYRTNYRQALNQGAPRWIAECEDRTYGSRYTMTECLNGVVASRESPEGNFVRLVIPKGRTTDGY